MSLLQKPVLLSIKQEEELLSDGEQYVDNTFSDSDGDEHDATNDATANDAIKTPNTTKDEDSGANDDTKNGSILATMVPFLAETVIEPPTTSNMFECYLCHKSWKTAGSLTYHFICYHTMGKTPKCHLCGKWIKDPSNMVRHLNMHFSTKNHQCHICSFSFARAASLRNHLIVHNTPNAAEFKCSKCEKVFISKKHLKIHKKDHVSNLKFPFGLYSRLTVLVICRSSPRPL